MKKNELQKSNKRNEFMKKILIYLSIICLSLFLFTLIIFIFIIYQGATNNNFSHLSEAGVASMLSIAITVWIGLNIYNVISKEDLDNFIEEQRNQIEKINEKSDGAINRLDTKTSIHKLLIMLEETMDKYVISYYFMLKFANDNDEIYDVDALVEIEYFFAKTTKYYERDNYQASLNFNKKCIKKVYKYKQMNGTLDNKLVQAFLNCREADLIYYTNVCNEKIGKDIDRDKLLASLDLYDSIKDYINQDNSIRYIKKEVLGYIYNTIGITYQLLLKKYKGDLLYIEKAELGFKNAIDVYKYSGRYKRNYGSFLENKMDKNKENIKKIIDLYESAMNLDPEDYKAINTYYSYLLKIIEYITGLDNNEILWGSVDLDGVKDKLEKYNIDLLKDKDRCIKIINESIYNFERAIVIAPVFCDSYYNKAKAIMLKCYFEGTPNSLLLDKGINSCDIALSINSNCVGALYIKRNTYELKQDLDKANEINEYLKNMNKPHKNEDLYKI